MLTADYALKRQGKRKKLIRQNNALDKSKERKRAKADDSISVVAVDLYAMAGSVL